jgi:FKBP-type peptidyl-prolyl cis-trans isomerase (trigger factor)
MSLAKNGTITFEITIPVADIHKGYQKVLLKVAPSVEVKGFRKGKAPLDLIEKQLDKSQLYSQVVEEVLPPAYSQAIISGKYHPVIDPHVTPLKFEPGKDWVFKVETAQKPEVILGDYEKYLKTALAKASTITPKSPIKGKEPETDNHDHAKNAKLSTIFDALLANANLDIAPILIDSEAKNQLSKLVKQLSSLKLTVNDYAKSLKKTENDLVAEYQKTAETNLKLEFILDKLVEKIAPQISEAEIAKLKPTADQTNYAKYILQKQKVLDKLTSL